MARYATGKKAVAISDRSGFKIKHKDLKTTWDGLRVEKEEWEPKHPQLTPAKNVFDATALFNPRPDNDPENVSIFIGFNYDPFIDPRLRPPVGVSGISAVGNVTGVSGGQINLNATPSGVAGTGAIGVEVLNSSIAGTGAAGAGAVGTGTPLGVKGVSGLAGTGAVGVEALSLSIAETGVAGTGAVGNESVNVMGWGNRAWGDDTWGDG